LQNIRGGAKAILAGAERAETVREPNTTLYGLTIETVEQRLSVERLNTWKDFDSYSENYLEIGLNVPVQYLPHWLPDRLKKDVRRVESRLAKFDFSVFYDGTELRKPILFRPDDDAFLERFEFKGRNVSASGYFYAQHGSIKPIELHGLLVRIRDSAVGEFDPAFWGFSQSEYSLIQKWVSAEIWADDRLEDAMNIDRRTLRVTHPAYIELRDAIHSALRHVFSAARSRVYEKGNRQRKTARAATALQAIAGAATAAGLSDALAREMVDAWSSQKTRKRLLKKYSIADIYEAVLETSAEILTSEQAAKFIRRLTERLGDG
jgi:hypothetical protein